MTHRYAALPADGAGREPVRLHYVEAGHGPLVVLLHGFPEAWFSWQHQIPALAAAGFRVVAPDMRGYNLSSKPPGVSAYTVDLLARDVAALIRCCGAERATVAGHDWGGGVAWTFAMQHPELLDRLVILNSPHPVRFAHSLRTLRQLRKSAYMFFFQLPRLPEAAIAARDFALLRSVFRQPPVRPGAFTDEDIEYYVEANRQPGALTASLNYYRAAFRYPQLMWDRLRPVAARVLVIWGEQDPYLGRELVAPDRLWAPRCRVECLPDASHWVQMDQPARVNELLLSFLADVESINLVPPLFNKV